MGTNKVFAEGIVQNIKEYLPDEFQDVECTVVESQKNNGTIMTGVNFGMPDKSISSTIYTDPLYDEIRHGKSIETVMKEIADFFLKVNERHNIVDKVDFLEYETVKHYIEPVLVNQKANQRLLYRMPYKRVQDLAVIYKIVFPYDVGRASMNITNEMIKAWKIPLPEIHKVAFENGVRRHPAVLQSMETVIQGIQFNKTPTENLMNENEKMDYDELFVLSNSDQTNGATVLIYPDILKRIDEKFDGGCYILPSSVHECIVVPKNLGMTPKELGKLVREVNASEVAREEVLSDRVYEYDRVRNCLSQVEASIEKERNMER